MAKNALKFSTMVGENFEIHMSEIVKNYPICKGYFPSFPLIFKIFQEFSEICPFFQVFQVSSPDSMVFQGVPTLFFNRPYLIIENRYSHTFSSVNEKI